MPDDVEPCRVHHARHRGHRPVLQRRARHGAGRTPCSTTRSPRPATRSRTSTRSSGWLTGRRSRSSRRPSCRPTERRLASGVRHLPPPRHAGRHDGGGRRLARLARRERRRCARPVDHKIIYSIYFHDPDGNRLEITAPLDPDWNDDASAARASLAEWEQVKATARQSGRDMATVLAELTRRAQPPRDAARAADRLRRAEPNAMDEASHPEDHQRRRPRRRARPRLGDGGCRPSSATRGPRVERRGVREHRLRRGRGLQGGVRRRRRRTRPTPGSTRTSSTPTSGWWPPSAIRATR